MFSQSSSPSETPATTANGRSAAIATRDPARRASGYRRDLDGLRGVAILLVVAFHIWFRRVSGGVDVFLVLSGFFFTGMLLRRVESDDSGPILPTLRRTAKRLLPALVVVLAAVSVASVLLSPYTQWAGIADQTLASIFYYQNWQLALTWSDYLAADPSVSPLQHLWSMAVQGQFYLAALLVIAVLAGLLRQFGRGEMLRPVVLILTLVVVPLSFVYAMRGTETHQAWNYYDTFARGWELLTGSALAVLAPLIRLARPIRQTLAVLGLAGVLLCGVVLDGANQFPGPAALLPVAATVAVILAGANLVAAERPAPNRWLASPVPVRLGELAYGLYLWHWPLLIFYMAESGQHRVGPAAGLALIALSLALAWFTHRCIEQPLRGRSRARHWAGPVVALLGVLVVSASSIWHVVIDARPDEPIAGLDQNLYPGAEALVHGIPVPPAPLRPSLFEAAADVPPPTRDGCIADWDTREVITCVYGDQTAERTLAVVGSSHAEHWLPALQVLAAEHRFRLEVYLKMGCPLTVAAAPEYQGESNPDCRDWSHEVIDRLAVDRPDWIFTTGTRPVDEGGDETPRDYLDVWTALAERGLNVVAIRDTPWLRRDGGVRYRAVDCLGGGGDPLSCGMRRDAALSPVDPAAEPAAGFPNVTPIDLTDAVCQTDICPVAAGNVLIYHDEHHLTASYSRSLAPALGRELGPVLRWW
ncbi:acyltransferase family protein [Nocardia sp. NPDC050435]|uniref:acyltransferase family protein n=1 Tax=Nocardia sp. NPDC050435 TaxID=3155040 RepID=UPI0033EB1878